MYSRNIRTSSRRFICRVLLAFESGSRRGSSQCRGGEGRVTNGLLVKMALAAGAAMVWGPTRGLGRASLQLLRRLGTRGLAVSVSTGATRAFSPEGNRNVNAVFRMWELQGAKEGLSQKGQLGKSEGVPL